MPMKWFERCLAPALKAKLGNKQMILVLDNPSYHHGYDAEERVPEGNSKGYNTELLRMYKYQNIPVEPDVPGSADDVRRKKYIFKVPTTRTFPQVNSKGSKGVISAAVNSSVLSAQTSHEAHGESGKVYQRAWVAYDLDPAVHAKFPTDRTVLAAR